MVRSSISSASATDQPSRFATSSLVIMIESPQIRPSDSRQYADALIHTRRCSSDLQDRLIMLGGIAVMPPVSRSNG
jgi:hypothetical protein